MAPKSAPAPAISKVTYKDMIKTAIVSLKERNGSSRQAVKKHVQANYDVKAASFDALFNAALRKGVETGDFAQPKGPSGPIKVAKKEKTVVAPTPAKVTKKAAPKKSEPEPKKAAAKKAVSKTVAKTPAKKVTKPATKAAAKKAAPKKAAPKKVAPKKAVPKKAAPKKPVAKTPVKKVVKPVKKTTLKKAIAA